MHTNDFDIGLCLDVLTLASVNASIIIICVLDRHRALQSNNIDLNFASNLLELFSVLLPDHIPVLAQLTGQVHWLSLNHRHFLLQSLCELHW